MIVRRKFEELKSLQGEISLAVPEKLPPKPFFRRLNVNDKTQLCVRLEKWLNALLRASMKAADTLRKFSVGGSRESRRGVRSLLREGAPPALQEFLGVRNALAKSSSALEPSALGAEGSAEALAPEATPSSAKAPSAAQPDVPPALSADSVSIETPVLAAPEVPSDVVQP
eukprot:2391721-Prymnesium_polylepis.1